MKNQPLYVAETADLKALRYGSCEYFWLITDSKAERDSDAVHGFQIFARASPFKQLYSDG